jgi:citrate lyase subunit beta/citryl-CoA lyase
MSSLLFVPAGETRKFHKACTLACRAIVVDLEDAVSAEAKEEARGSLAGFAIDAKQRRRELIVRMNGVHTSLWEEDVRAIVKAGPRTILVPKCEDPAQIQVLDDALADEERRLGLAAGTTKLILLLESARGLARMERLLSASPRIVSATIGMVDLCTDLGISWEGTMYESPPLFVEERLRLSILSRAANLERPWDTVYLAIDRPEAFREDVRLGRRLGCQGKFVIHPTQIPIVDETYRVSEAEIARAKRIVEEFEVALRAGRGAVSVDGMFVDEPVVVRARALLAGAADAG